MDPGVLVAEPDGEVELQEEGHPGDAGRQEHRQRRVEVNPFWSSRAVGEAELNAMRPAGLPKVPDTVSAQKVRKETDDDAGAGDAPAGDLPGRGVGSHPEAAGRTRNEEFWSEVKRDLIADLENAGAAEVANGGEQDPREGRRGEPALLHGHGREPHQGADPLPGDGRGSSADGPGRLGLMRGRSMEREGGARNPEVGPPRALRPGEERGDGPVPRPSDARDWRGGGGREPREPLRGQRALLPGEGQVHRQDQFGLEWDVAVRRRRRKLMDPVETHQGGGPGPDTGWTWTGSGVMNIRCGFLNEPNVQTEMMN